MVKKSLALILWPWFRSLHNGDET